MLVTDTPEKRRRKETSPVLQWISLTKCCEGAGEAGSWYIDGGIENGTATPQKGVMVPLKAKKKMHLFYDPVIAYLDIYLRENDLFPSRNWYTDIQSSFVDNSQKLETMQVSFHEWVVKQTGTSIPWNSTQP